MKNVDAVIAQIRASALALSNLADALEGKEMAEAMDVGKEVMSEEVEKKKSDEVKSEKSKEVNKDEKKETVKAEEVKKEEKTYTFEEVRTILTLKSREGKTEAVRALLQAHGAATLSALKEDDYSQVVKEAEGL